MSARPIGHGGLAGPIGLTFGPDGYLYATSSFGVKRYDVSTGARSRPSWTTSFRKTPSS
jgi:hypothetical protein